MDTEVRTHMLAQTINQNGVTREQKDQYTRAEHSTKPPARAPHDCQRRERGFFLKRGNL